VTSSLTEYILAYILTYGVIALGLALLIGAIGIPIPTTLLVVAGGAFIRQGLLSLPLVAVIGLIAAVTGDSLSYGIGSYAGGWVERRYGATAAWQSARGSFVRHGAWSIYLSRFLLTSIAIPVNLIAGSTSFGYRRFFPLVLIGEFTWLALFGGLGYAFGSQWEVISTFASDFGGLVFGLVILVAGLYLAFRLLRKNRLPSNQATGEQAISEHAISEQATSE
jgi:membrane-associated protein